MKHEVKALKDSLDHSDTYPDMAKSIVRSLCVVMEGKEPSLRWTTRTPLHEMIKVAFYKQQRIGWKQAFLGHISSRWKKYIQQKWYQNRQVWATNLCRRLMFLALNRWQIRNEVYHDRVSKYSYLRDREVLIVEVSARFEIIQPDHPAVNRLFSNSLDQLITSTNSSMQAWMTSYYRFHFCG